MTEDERNKYSQIGNMRLCVCSEEAVRLLQQISHKTFRDAMEIHWQLETDVHVTPESICWLFCWAETGMGSHDTAEACYARFNRIFVKSYDWFDRNIGPKFARKFRYRKPRRIGL